MTANLPTYNYLQFVRFKSLSLWDVKKNRIFDNKEISDYDFVRLADVLTQVKRVEFLQPTKDYNLLGVKSYGLGVFHRETKKGNDIKAKYLWELKEGDLVYSRLGASSGSFGLINKDFDNYFVSNEFPAFTIDSNRVLPQYLNLVLTSKRFYEKIADFNTGSALKRFHEDKFLNLEIPLPALSIQKEIINNYTENVKAINKIEANIIDIENKRKQFLEDYFGIYTNSISIQKGIKMIRYKNLDFKWGTDFNLNKNRWTVKPNFPLHKISQLCNVGSGGTPDTSNKSYYNGNIPWIKTTEVINELIIDTEVKITERGLENSSAKIYPKGSLIIAMYGQGLTRGRTAKLGIDASTNQACAVLFNINSSVIDTDFLWIYLMNEYDRLRELASGNNQPNLNAGMILDYKVQVPVLSEQNKITDYYFKEKDKIISLKKQAESLRSHLEITLTNSIFNR